MTSTTHAGGGAHPIWRTIDPRDSGGDCDRCGSSARAKVTVLFAAPSSPSGAGILSLCAHHYRWAEAALAPRILDIRDGRDGVTSF